MKKIVFITLASLLSITGFAQNSVNWEKVVLTKNPEETKGLTRVGNVEGKASKIFGKEDKLRAMASVKIKKAAADMGATVVFLENDNFGNSPINNVVMKGVAYSSLKNGEGNTTTNSETHHPTLSEKLRELKELFDEGLITKEEYEVQKKKVLDKNR